jgi:hypothetical protein
MSLFDCVSTAGFSNDRLHFSYSYNSPNYYDLLYLDWSQGATSRYSSNMYFGIPQIGQWFHFAVTVNEFGNVDGKQATNQRHKKLLRVVVLQ